MSDQSENDFQSVNSIGRKELQENIKDICSSCLSEPETTLDYIGEDTSAFYNEFNDSYDLRTNSIFCEGVDFDLTYHPIKHLGYKLSVATISRILGMNGQPKTISVNVALPNKISVPILEDFYKGIVRFCNNYDIKLTGFDIRAAQQVIVSVNASGIADSGHISFRKGAQLDDAICVSGDLGGAIAGLRILLREKKFWKEQESEHFQPDLSEYEFVVQKQLLPEFRHDLCQKMNELNIVPNAMTLVGEGLVNDMFKITQASGYGAFLYQAALPIALPTRSVADEMGTDVDKYALYGGEDFQLLFTLPEEKVEQLNQSFDDFTVIGKIKDNDGIIKMQSAEGDVITFNS